MNTANPLAGKSEEYKRGFVDGQRYGWHEGENDRKEIVRRTNEHITIMEQALQDTERKSAFLIAVILIGGLIGGYCLGLVF